MLKKKSLSVLLASSLVVSGFAAAVPAYADDAAAAVTTSQAAVPAGVDVAAQLKAFADLKALFTATPDLANIKAQYIEKFQPSVQALDAKIKKGDPTADVNIMFILNNAVEGKLNAGQAKQALDKGLQWYFYLLIRDQVNVKAKSALEKGDVAAAKLELDKALQVYKGVTRSTAEKRDAKFKTKMVDLLDNTVFPALAADVEKKDVASFNLHRQMLDKTIIKIYTLATLTYAEAAPAKPAEAQAEAMTEGYFLFLPVYSYLKGGSAADADYVLNAFGSGDVSKVNLTSIKEALARANIGKVSEYVKRAGESIETAPATAQVLAMEGVMFLAALETYLIDALGADAYAQATVYGQAFLEAVLAGDQAAAEAEGFRILQSISKLDGISLTIGSKELVSKGKTVEMDVASHLDATTERTLVPARFIAEALGAEVAFDETTQTVVITKAGVKTELVIGSQQVVRGGSALELKLDQPAKLVDGRTFIPLRAVAELFGNKVFYHDGNVVIVK